MTAKTELITWDILRPFGDSEDHASLLRCTIDGVEWITDRYVLVKADLIDGARDDMVQGFYKDEHAAGLIEALPRLFALEPCEGPNAAPVHPIYLAAFEGYDWTPVEKFQWQIRRDGELVAMVCGLTNAHRPGEGGKPGDLTPAMRRTYEIIRREVWNTRSAWELAYRIEVDRT